MAERKGFEPLVRFPVHTLSKRAPSTTRTSLRSNGLKVKRLIRPIHNANCEVRRGRNRSEDIAFAPRGHAALIEEPDPAGGKVVHRAHEFHFALRRAGPAFGRFEHVPNGPAHVGLDRRAEQRRRGKRWNRLRPGPGRCARAAARSGWRGGRQGTARRSPPPPRRNPRAPTPRTAARAAPRLSLQPRDGGEGMLALEVRPDFLLHGREARGSAYEAFVALLQAIERLLRGVVGMMLAGHDSRSPCRSAMGTRIVARPPDVCARMVRRARRYSL